MTCAGFLPTNGNRHSERRGYDPHASHLALTSHREQPAHIVYQKVPLMTTNEPRPSCFARMLDTRSYVVAARRAMLTADATTALYMIATFGLIALLLTPLYLSYDLGSTWAFTTGLRAASTEAVGTVTGQIDGFLGLSVGALLAGVILTSFTFLPSLFELAFPAVTHPLLNLVLTVSIVFDYITDWGKTWDLTAQWCENPTVHFFAAMVLTGFFSVGVQAVLVCCLTVVGFGLFSLIRGGTRKAEAVIVNQR